MTISLDTAMELDNLGLTIFNPHEDPVMGTVAGAATYISSPDPNIDAQLAALIAEPMLTIDGRTLATGFHYTLNVTNALQLRAKHWYLRGIEELDSTSLWPASTAFSYMPSPGAVVGGANSFGMTIGLATCAAICHVWAMVIRMWMMKNYPLGVTAYDGPIPDPTVVGTAALAAPYYTQNPPM